MNLFHKPSLSSPYFVFPAHYLSWHSPCPISYFPSLTAIVLFSLTVVFTAKSFPFSLQPLSSHSHRNPSHSHSHRKPFIVSSQTLFSLTPKTPLPTLTKNPYSDPHHKPFHPSHSSYWNLWPPLPLLIARGTSLAIRFSVYICLSNMILKLGGIYILLNTV